MIIGSDGFNMLEMLISYEYCNNKDVKEMQDRAPAAGGERGTKGFNDTFVEDIVHTLDIPTLSPSVPAIEKKALFVFCYFCHITVGILCYPQNNLLGAQ